MGAALPWSLGGGIGGIEPSLPSSLGSQGPPLTVFSPVPNQRRKVAVLGESAAQAAAVW